MMRRFAEHHPYAFVGLLVLAAAVLAIFTLGFARHFLTLPN